MLKNIYLAKPPKKLLGDEKMEKMLDAFAKGLLIQSSEENGSKTKEASDEQKAAFKEALREHLNFASRIRAPGFVVTYDYYQGKIRGGKRPEDETTVASPNGNLATVLCKLPELCDGETYVFPVPTFISFRIKERYSEETFETISFCQWIKCNLQ